MRTQAEIRARYNSLEATDMFGFRREALFEAFEFETVKDLLKDGVTPDDWDPPDVETTARNYLVFAIGKAVDHRGISANRSIEKLDEWLWCLEGEHGAQNLREKFHEAPYPQYGAPMLAVLEDAWKITHDYVDDEQWLRMRVGKTCRDDCMDGCGTDFITSWA